MKKTNFFQNKLVKGLSVALLTLLSVCCFTLGFLGLGSKLNNTDAAAVAANATDLKAWYRFDTLATFGTDSTNNGYNLTVNNSASFNDSYNGMRLLPTKDDETNSSLFASTTAADPLYGLTLDSSLAISMALYLGGPSAGGSGYIVTNSNWDGNFAVAYSNGDLSVYLGGVRVALWAETSSWTSGGVTYTHPYNKVAIPNGAGKYGWYRLTININKTAANVKLVDVNSSLTDLKAMNIAPTLTAGTLVTDSARRAYEYNSVDYTLTKSLASQADWSFSINGKALLNTAWGALGSGCGGTNVRVPVESNTASHGIKIGDLRIYNGAITEGEENNINHGDKTRAKSMHLVAAYEHDNYKFYNEYSGAWATNTNGHNYRNSIGIDSTGYVNLARRITTADGTYDNTHWDNSTFSAHFNGPNSLMYAYGSNEATFYSSRTVSKRPLDFSDYMRKGCYTVALRAYVTAGVEAGSAYYLMNTGQYSRGCSIGVSWGSIVAYASRHDGSDEAEATLTAPISIPNNAYVWVNVVLYSNGSQVWLSAKKDGDANWTTVTPKDKNGAALSYAGSSFGGYGYSFTIGAQSNFGQNQTNLCYNVNAGREQIKLRSLKIYGGSWNDQNIADIRADLDALKVTTGTNSSFSLEAHYKFDGSTAIGKDSSGNGYDLVNPGNMKYDSYEGGVVLDYNNSTNPSENPDHFLYAPKGSGASSNLDWSDNYQGSYAVSMRAKLSTAETGRAHKLYSTTRHGGGSDNYTGSHAAFQGNSFEIMVNGYVFFFSNVLDATPSWYRIFYMYDDTNKKFLCVVFKETDSTYFVQQAKTLDSLPAANKPSSTDADGNALTQANTDFGGNAAYLFTIGAQYSVSAQDTGAGSGAGFYDPVISEFRFYSGVVNTTEINNILALDANNYKIDTDNSNISMNVGSNMNLNYHLRAKNAQQLSGLEVAYAFNKHTQTVKPTLDNTGDYVGIMSLMAPQDMNDEIEITSITFDMPRVTGTVNFEGTGLTQVLTREDLLFNNWKRIKTSAKIYLEEVVTSDKTTANEKALAKALLNYGTAVQEYWSHTENGLINSGLSAADKSIEPTTSQKQWLANNVVKSMVVSSASSAVQPWVANIYFDNNLGLGIRYTVPKTYDSTFVDDFTVKIFKGTDITATPVFESVINDENKVYKLTNAHWGFDAYQITYENVKLGGLTDVYTFVVYHADASKGTTQIVSQISMNTLGLIQSYMASDAEGDRNLGKSLFKVYCVANGIA